MIQKRHFFKKESDEFLRTLKLKCLRRFWTYKLKCSYRFCFVFLSRFISFCCIWLWFFFPSAVLMPPEYRRPWSKGSDSDLNGNTNKNSEKLQYNRKHPTTTGEIKRVLEEPCEGWCLFYSSLTSSILIFLQFWFLYLYLLTLFTFTDTLIYRGLSTPV